MLNGPSPSHGDRSRGRHPRPAWRDQPRRCPAPDLWAAHIVDLLTHGILADEG